MGGGNWVLFLAFGSPAQIRPQLVTIGVLSLDVTVNGLVSKCSYQLVSDAYRSSSCYLFILLGLSSMLRFFNTFYECSSECVCSGAVLPIDSQLNSLLVWGVAPLFLLFFLAPKIPAFGPWH